MPYSAFLNGGKVEVVVGHGNVRLHLGDGLVGYVQAKFLLSCPECQHNVPMADGQHAFCKPNPQLSPCRCSSSRGEDGLHLRACTQMSESGAPLSSNIPDRIETLHSHCE
jgi:hypothetical protein